MKALDFVREAASRIGGDTARLDAELIVAHALGIGREALLLGAFDLGDVSAADALIARRMALEPMAYILGHQEFWSLDLVVTPDVLIPRADSETLVAAALAIIPMDAPARVLDLGTGSGALMLAVLSERQFASALATDSSAAALSIARRNAIRLDLADRCEFRVADWAGDIDERFDLVLCNPPYIAVCEEIGAGVSEYEPHAALFAGGDGLDDYRKILPQLLHLLRPGGAAILEIGYRQAGAVLVLGEASGLAGHVECDLAGRDRMIRFHAF